MQEFQKETSIKIASRLLILVLIVLICYTLQSIVVPILFALILSVLLLPICERLEKWGVGRAFASIISLIFAILIVLGIAYLVVSQTLTISQDTSEILNKIQSLLKSMLDWASDQFHVSSAEIMSRVEKELGNSFSTMGQFISTGLNSIGSSLTYFILIPVMIFFFLYYREFFKEFFFRIFVSKPKKEIEEVIRKIYDVLRNYLVGLITVMGIVAILNTIGLTILGIEHAVFFGVLAAMLTIFPYVGIFIGSLIPALFALATKDSAWYAGGVILWFQLVQTLEGNFITPKIVGGKASLNPLVSLLSFFLGGMLFGILGMILALPILAMLKVIFDALPETSAYGFLLSEPNDSYILSEQQKKRKMEKQKRAEQKKKKESE
ncbi:AI-2E family transporter [Moheibacter lacus]|uniref:AI-2E family transporter n=1 Tax=Moheibacter lacus TaxID=2745851 RepID=A0A838ZMV6_9FLAO|nr:AI-2E family transporter [Moheibacter lacus]MBA5629170.1 AI-2E family transporter [Moheibacter lacus]